MSKILCLHINLSEHVITKSIREPGSSYYEIFKDVISNNINVRVSEIFCIRDNKVYWQIMTNLQKPFCRPKLGFVVIRTGGPTSDDDLGGCIICLQTYNKPDHYMVCGHSVHRECFLSFVGVDSNLECLLPWCKSKFSNQICRVCNVYVMGLGGSQRDSWCCGRVVHFWCRNKEVPKGCNFYKSQKHPNSLQAICQKVAHNGDIFIADVNFVNSQMTKHIPATKLEVCVTEKTTLRDFMQDYFPKLNEKNTQVAFGNSVMLFDSWQQVNLKACVEMFSARINIRSGFEFGDNPYQSRQRKMKRGVTSQLSLHMLSQQVYCESCNHYTEVNIPTGIYRESQLNGSCELCKMNVIAIRLSISNLAFGSGFHERFQSLTLPLRQNDYLFLETNSVKLNVAPNLVLCKYSAEEILLEIVPIGCALCFNRVSTDKFGSFDFGTLDFLNGNFFYSCGHQMCSKCDKKWNDDKCPICRDILIK